MSHKDYDVQNKFELVKFKDRHTSYVLQTECGGNRSYRTRERARRAGEGGERKKRGSGMKSRVDRSRE
jgi:hypothetical protein